MKRFYVWIVVLLSVFALCACQEKENRGIYRVTHEGKDYTVNQEQGTITCDGVVYQFEVSNGGGKSVRLDILYPDGSKYFWIESDYNGYGGYSDDYHPAGMGYIAGDILWDVLGLGPDAKSASGPSPLLALLLIAVGAFHAFAPQTAWMLGHGWRFRDAEPSDLALDLNRILGGVLIFIGGILLLSSILSLL